MIHESCISFMFWLSRKLCFFPQVNTNPYFCFSREHKIWKRMQKSKCWKYSKALSIFSLNWIVFQHDANRPTLHLLAPHQIIFLNELIFQNDARRPPLHSWALYRDFLFKMNHFSKWRKPSDPSFVGASSIFLFKMNRFFKISVMLKNYLF